MHNKYIRLSDTISLWTLNCANLGTYDLYITFPHCDKISIT